MSCSFFVFTPTKPRHSVYTAYRVLLSLKKQRKTKKQRRKRNERKNGKKIKWNSFELSPFSYSMPADYLKCEKKHRHFYTQHIFSQLATHSYWHSSVPSTSKKNLKKTLFSLWKYFRFVNFTISCIKFAAFLPIPTRSPFIYFIPFVYIYCFVSFTLIFMQ